MIRNYFKIAWRNLKKQPFFTSLNVFGLAIGMAGALLLCLYIYDELHYDKMFADADRIHRINVDIKFGGDVMNSSEVSDPIAGVINTDYPQVELTTRFRESYGMLIRKDNTVSNVKETNTTRVDASFFEMFGIKVLHGDANTALKDANTLVMTKTAAEKHFPIHEAVGKSVLINNEDTYVITGIIDDLPKNSFLRNHSVFLTMTGFAEAEENNWGGNNFPTFVKLLPTAKIDEFETFLMTLTGKYIIPYAQSFMPGITEEQLIASGNYFNFSTINLQDIHLHSNKNTEMSPNGSIQNVYILSFIALFLIILASVNFMNLSTANSLKRAKEVGIRKTLGSSKLELIGQFLAESGLISMISLLFAVIIAALILPFFNELADKDIALPFTNPVFWLVLFLSGLVLGLFSGIYPAFFMSRFVPVRVLKGDDGSSAGGASVRNSLVIFQFAISVFLIVSTLVVFEQLEYIQNKDLGYNKERVLLINDVHAMGNHVQSFKSEVKKIAQVENVSLSGFVPTPSSRSDSSFFLEGATELEDAIQMQRWGVDYDYVNTLNLEIISGRDFDQKFSTDSLATIINEAALKIIGLQPEEVLGKRITRDFGVENSVFYTVVGVVKDFHFKSLRDHIGALSLTISDFSNAMIIKLKPGDFTNTLNQIEKSWMAVAPGQPFSYNFMEESFSNTYSADQKLGRIFTIFTIISILIACLGLFGLAAFNAERRTKEIGIRKVLGASLGQITYKLSIDFLKLVGISTLISIPLSWYAMNKWLEDFSYRIEIGLGVFVVAIVLAILISILTLSFQSIKAALANPVNSLRTE